MKTMCRAALAACLACAWLAGPAQAHVTVHPNVVPAGGFTVVNVQVPNERDDANTTKVEVQFPPGFLFVSTQPVPGWSADLKMRKLAAPVEVFGEKHTEEADRLTLTTNGKGIAPGQFIQFPMSVRVPEKVDAPLTFKALQTYSNGEVVRWIGAPDAESPAPQVAVGKSSDAIADLPGGISGAGHGAGHGQAANSDTPAATSASSDDGGPSTALVIVALVLGALGMLTGIAGLMTARRATARPVS